MGNPITRQTTPVRLRIATKVAALMVTAMLACAAVASPQRVVSLNLCTDLLLESVAAPRQIAGLSHVAADPAYSPIAEKLGQQANNIPLHSGRAEQIIRLRPDLIIAPSLMQGSAKLLERLGYRVVRLNLPQTLDDIGPALLAIGELLDQPQRAASVAAKFTARRSRARINALSQQRALIVGPNRYTSGSQGFKSSVLAATGLASAAATINLPHSGAISLEQLIVADPDLLVIDDSTVNQQSLAQSFRRHPALQLMQAREVLVQSRYWLCASPHVAHIWQQLAELANG